MLALFFTLLIVFETIAYVSTTPRPNEQFFQLYVLGANHIAIGYYPANKSSIQPNTDIRWYLGVTNFMGNVQLVALRVKLGNQSILAPNDTQALPSPAPVVVEFMRFLQNNETWETPFIWKIANATTGEGSTRILELGINNEIFVLQDSSARNGRNFRLIFELWTWNLETQGLQFGWFAGNEHRIAWLQLWFNVTASSPT